MVPHQGPLGCADGVMQVRLCGAGVGSRGRGAGNPDGAGNPAPHAEGHLPFTLSCYREEREGEGEAGRGERGEKGEGRGEGGGRAMEVGMEQCPPDSSWQAEGCEGKGGEHGGALACRMGEERRGDEGMRDSPMACGPRSV